MPAFGSPEEFNAYVQEQHARMQAEAEDSHNQFNEFLTGLPPEQIVVFRNACLNMSRSKHIAAHNVGLADALLQFVHKVCINCGKDHEADAMEKLALEEAARNQPQQSEPATEQSMADLEAEMAGRVSDAMEASRFEAPVPTEARADTDYNETWRFQPGTHELYFTPHESENMRAYNLDDAYDEVEPHMFRGFQCKGCGLLYQSIADRMLKRPDECHGCFLKSANG